MNTFAVLISLILITIIFSSTFAEFTPNSSVPNWQKALQELRTKHSYFFSQNANNDILIEFENYLGKMRGFGINVDSPDGWNALAGVRNPTKQRFDVVNPNSNGTTRADRFSQFKLPIEIDEKAMKNANEHILTPKGKVFIETGNDLASSLNVNNEVTKMYNSLQKNQPGSNCLPGDTTCVSVSLAETDPDTEEPTTTTPQEPPPISQHNIPSVQGLESNRGASAMPVTTQSWCRSVLQDSFRVYPQKLIIDFESGAVGFQDLECERHIERDDLVRILPIAASLISDDQLRYDFAKLGCSWFYRPLENPTKLPCVAQCTVIRNFVRDLDITLASPAQLKDRAVLQTIAWPILLLAGQCEYTAFYHTSNDPAICIHPNDYTTFKPLGESTLGRPECKPYPEKGSVCSGLLTNSLYDPTTTKSNTFLDQLSPLLKSIYAIAPTAGNYQCARSLAKQICSKYILSCTEVPITMMDAEGQVYAIKYALPVLPHRAVCEDYSKNCSPFLQTLSSLNNGGDTETFQRALSLLDPSCDSKSPVGAVYECDGVRYTSTYDSFPKSTSYSMSLGVSVASIRTNNFTYATQYDQSRTLPFYPDIECPAPLVVPESLDDPSNGRIGTTSCALPCPSVAFNETNYQAVSTTAVVLTTLSFVCAIFLFGSYLFFKEIRRGNYFLQFLLCLMMICSAFAIGSYSRYHSNESIQASYCVSNSQIATQEQNIGCTIEAFVVVFAILAIAAFFASSGFDLFLRIVLQVEVRPHTQQDYLLNLGYYFWGWTVPLLLTTISAGTKSLGPSDAAFFYCFVQSRANGTVPWATFYLPILVQLFIGCVSLGSTIYYLARNEIRHREEEFDRQARDYNYRGGKPAQITVGTYLVPLLLELIFFLYLGLIVLIRAIIHFTENRSRSNITTYANCLLITKPINRFFSIMAGEPSDDFDCGSPSTIPVGLWWFNQIFMPALGIFTFLVLGTQRIYYQLWAAVIGYYLNFPTLLVWAATTQQAKIYGRRLARQRRMKARKLRKEGATDTAHDQAAVEGMEIVEQIKEQDKLVKEKLRQEQEEKQKKEREKAQQMQQQNLNMIAPHLRPLYMIQQRPRRVLPSLVDLAQNPDAIIGPAPVSITDIYVTFNVQVDSTPLPTSPGQPARKLTSYDDYMSEYI